MPCAVDSKFGELMKYKILCVGKLKEQYWKEAVAEYCKRLSRFAKVEICEVEECVFCGIPNAKETEKIVEAEGQSILQKAEGCLVALDIDGRQLDSVQFSDRLEKLTQSYSCVTFVIGGSYGLSQEVKSRAQLRLSFGAITLPHQLCRVVLCEQLYRACTIRNNLPYHK